MMAMTERLRTETTTVYTDGADLVFERVFDAPRELVWKVMVDPALITSWWGPQGYTTTVLEMDVRAGGRWHFINHTTGGEDVGFMGEYLDVDPPRSYRATFIVDMDGLRDNVGVGTFTLEDLGERTKLITRSTFPSPADLEVHMSNGMINGSLDTWDRLAVVLAESRT